MDTEIRTKNRIGYYYDSKTKNKFEVLEDDFWTFTWMTQKLRYTGLGTLMVHVS